MGKKKKTKKKKKDYYRCGAKTIEHSHKGQHVEMKVLEKQIERKFKHLQFTDEFIKLTMEQVRKEYEKRKSEIGFQKRALFNRKMAIESKRDRFEEKLISGAITDDDFVRIRERLRKELDSTHDQIQELESKRDLDVDILRDVLLLSRNIYEAYKKAPDDLKRLYLGFFWKGFVVKDKKIIKTMPSEFMQTLLRENKIRKIRATGLRGQDSNLQHTA